MAGDGADAANPVINSQPGLRVERRFAAEMVGEESFGDFYTKRGAPRQDLNLSALFKTFTYVRQRLVETHVCAVPHQDEPAGRRLVFLCGASMIAFMRASFWVGLVVAVFLFLLGSAWYRERARAQRAIAAKEEIALELANLLQSKTSLDQSRVDHDELNLGAIPPLTGNDPKSTTPSNSSSLEITTPALVLPNVTTEVTNLYHLHHSSGASVTSGNAAESLPYTEQQLEIYRCCNQMCEINIAAERWASDHNGLIPPNLMELRGYLAPMLLICPGSRPRALSAAWEQFKPEDISYQVSPSSSGKQWDFQVPGQSPVTVIWLRCSIHKKLSTDNRIRFGGIPGSQEFRAR